MTPNPPNYRQRPFHGFVTEVNPEAGTFTLHSPSGVVVPVHYRGDFSDLDGWQERTVRLRGTAHFGEGRYNVVRYDADAVEVTPVPIKRGPTQLDRAREHQRRTGGLRNAIGQWPGDETDEEIEEILRELS